MTDDSTVRSGSGEGSLTEQQVVDAIRPVTDPEVGFSIVDLGLIYEVVLNEQGRDVEVKMTLTSPMCPVGPQILAATHAAVESLDGVESVDVQLVWDPPWDPAVMASEEVKDRLGIW
jgi:metal-sulfur cluster biosynthetic enzyme